MLNRQLIKRKRKEFGYSQDDVAIRVGYATKGSISRIESGEITDIPVSKAIRISKILEIEMNDLVKGGYHD
jgi:transcriptional regulator with XRE-family HTH domain